MVMAWGVGGGRRGWRGDGIHRGGLAMTSPRVATSEQSSQNDRNSSAQASLGHSTPAAGSA